MLQKSTISPYVESIMEEYPNLHFIAFTDTQVLAISSATKKAHFFYEVNEDMAFHFNMLCEVAAPYQIWFNQIMKDLNYEVMARETTNDYYDIIIES